MSKPSVLTLVGKSFARKGFRFYYQGKNPACTEDCRLFQTCQKNLVPNTVYEVVELMKVNPFTFKMHSCPKDLHEEEMNLVRVQIPDVVVSIRTKGLFIGSTTKYVPINCDKKDCPEHPYCVPETIIIKPDEKIALKDDLGKIKVCPKGENLTKIRVEKR